MKHIALLRGINVGGNKKVEMKRLKNIFESLGFAEVSTYINSGNIIFESDKKSKELAEKIEKTLEKEFGFNIPTIVRTKKEIIRIAEAIPKNWKNDSTERTDVAYLFPEIDTKKTVADLPVKKEFIDVRYVKGAVYWNLKRENVYKSQLGKLIGHKLYKSMTIRNINTARFLAGIK